jgi:hypothetical protein
VKHRKNNAETTGSGHREGPPLTSHLSVTRGPDVTSSFRTPRSANKGGNVQCAKGISAMQTLPALWAQQRNCGYAPSCVECGDSHQLGKCVSAKQYLKCCSCGENHTAKYRGCSKWKEAKAAATIRAQGECGRKDGASKRLAVST